MQVARPGGAVLIQRWKIQMVPSLHTNTDDFAPAPAIDDLMSRTARPDLLPGGILILMLPLKAFVAWRER